MTKDLQARSTRSSLNLETSQDERPEKHVLREMLSGLLTLMGWAIPFWIVGGLITGDFAIAFGYSFSISISLYSMYWLDYMLLRPRIQHLTRGRRLMVEMLSSLLETALGGGFALWIVSRLYQFDLRNESLWIPLLIMFAFFILARSIRYAAIFYRELQEKEVTEQRLRALAAQAELRALKAQINPHFLFNTLNTIASLIHSNPDQAEATLQRLAEMFRYILTSSTHGLGTLEAELAFVHDYLEIERARFGQRLETECTIDSDLNSFSIPTLILQPIVENAVRHGQNERGEIKLSIDARREGDRIVIQVSDCGPGMPEGSNIAEGPGIGLRNVDERLRKLYGKGFGLAISTNHPQGAIISISLPVDRSNDQRLVEA